MEFINEIISEVIKLLGTSQAAILAHSKEENANYRRTMQQGDYETHQCDDL